MNHPGGCQRPERPQRIRLVQVPESGFTTAIESSYGQS